MSARNRGFEVVSKRKHPTLDIELPKRADKGSAGYDFSTPYSLVIAPQREALIWTDIKSYMQEDEVLEVHIRSSLGINKGLQLKNTTGIIDSSYYGNNSNDGNIGICIYNNGEEPVVLNKGDRIAQGIFKKYLVVDNDVTISTNRVGGIGSSGN